MVMRQALKGAGLLIALYLGVRYATGAGSLIKAGANGIRTDVTAFQGR
jgi:hypothetical protein